MIYIKFKNLLKNLGITEYYYLLLKYWLTFQIFFKELIFIIISKDKKVDLDFNKKQYKKLIKKLKKSKIEWPLKKNQNNHIVYAGIKSHWEIVNIPHELSKLGKVSTFFLNDKIKSKSKRKIRNYVDLEFYNWICETNKINKINVIITYYSGAEIYPKTILKIKKIGIPIFTFHLDDRLHFFGRLSWFKWTGPYGVCKYYDATLSSCIYTLKQYEFFDSVVLYSPEGANPDYFKPNKNIKKKYDVVFIGAKYGKREKFIKKLKKKGINVHCFGYGWKNGLISNEDYVKIINQSIIVLGFGYISFTNYQTLKGRDFEVPSCGAIYLTTYNNELSKLYKIDDEIITFKDVDECYNKIKYVLNNFKYQLKIQKNSRKKVLKSHTWEKRFSYLIYGE